MRKYDELCTPEQLGILNTFKISKRKSGTQAKKHKFIVKMIKRARVLGLLPFTHMKLTA